MTGLAAWGIVLPTSTLSEGWFAALALFVAVNTLFFAGLSLAKLVPKRRTPRDRRRRSPSG